MQVDGDTDDILSKEEAVGTSNGDKNETDLEGLFDAEDSDEEFTSSAPRPITSTANDDASQASMSVS
jgi:hypothetical protein